MLAFDPFIIFKPDGDGITWPSFETTDGRPP
jgi:hypothetical protein